MDHIAQEALKRWNMPGARCTFHAHRENIVYHVSSTSGSFALRLHRRGYRSNDELYSELTWMAAVANGGVSVPSPRATSSGTFLEIIDGVQVDMLAWLAGDTLAAVLEGNRDERLLAMRRVARETARFHDVCDNWILPAGFDRPKWDIAGLVGENPLWGRFWENPALSQDDAEFFSTFRRTAQNDLKNLLPGLDYGLIHADLLRENVLIDNDDVRFIDFDDGGFGFRLFEISTALIRLIDDADYTDLRQAFVDEYARVRPLNTDPLDLFLALRASTYVGWIADRPDLPDVVQRQETNAKIARRLIKKYMNDQ